MRERPRANAAWASSFAARCSRASACAAASCVSSSALRTRSCSASQAAVSRSACAVVRVQDWAEP